MNKQLTLALLCLGSFSPFFKSQAQTTRTVCASGGCNYTSIQLALNAANNGDTILLNIAGNHTEKNIILPEKNLVIRGLGKMITYLQSAASPANAAGGRIFSYTDPVGLGNNSITIENMSIQNAYVPVDPVTSQAVGGVFFSRAPKGLKLAFNNVRMNNNQTVPGSPNNSGGACIYISATGTGFTYNADVSLNNCEFDDNYLGTPVNNAWGTVLYLLGAQSARITVNNCSFSNNTAYNGGGAVYCGANWQLFFKNSKFENNTFRAGGDGGCFRGASGSWNFDNCLFINNKALVGTGLGGVWSGAGAKFKSCTFYGNEAFKGGAIYRQSAGFEVNGNTEMQLINCTFYANRATLAGRAIHYGGTSPTVLLPLVMVNTIITNGTGAAASDLHFTVPYSQLNTNLKNYCTSVGTENTTPGTTPIFAFTAGNSTPGIVAPPAANGGSYESLALAANSSFINAGTNTTGTTYDISIKDQRNYSRFDGAIDVGSFEFNGLADNADGPAITYTPLNNTLLTTNRTITATITDANGIYWYPQTTDLRPRIYFRKNSGAWFSAVGTPQSGNGTNGTWQFTISSATMGSVALGDMISYYIVAQDVSGVANIRSNPGGVLAADVNNITTAPTPASYLISSVLPVKLTRFTAKTAGNDALLNWTSAEELNLAYYEIERSSHGNNWVSVAKIPGNSTHQYSYTDAGLATGEYLYRLRMVDVDETFNYSDSRSIRIAKGSNAFWVRNSQVDNNILNIEVYQPTQLKMFDANGRLVWQKKVTPASLQVNVTGFSKGIYFVTSGETTERIQIQ